MASMGSGYDLSVATFSPDGRLFQIEYAAKAIEGTGLTLGAIFKDGAVLAVDKFLPSAKLLDPKSSTRVFKVAPHVICAVAGYLPDAQELVSRARSECSEYKKVWGVPISGAVLADRLGLFVHGHTVVWSTRPFGCAIIFAVYDDGNGGAFPVSSLEANRATDRCDEMGDGAGSGKPGDYSLWVIDPTGAAYKYRATAIAQGTATAKSELEKLKFDNLTCKEGLLDFAKILQQSHQEVRERESKLEMIWLRATDGNEAAMVPEEVLKPIEEEAKAFLERMEVE